MTFFVTTLNKNENVFDNWFNHEVFNYLKITQNINDCDAVIYLRFKVRDFKFQFDTEQADTILNLSKKIIIFDYIEYNHINVSQDSYLNCYDILGYKIDDYFLKLLYKHYDSDSINKKNNYFLKFREQNLIYCYFKRELSSFLKIDNIGFPVYPCDYCLDYTMQLPSYNNMDEYVSNKPIDIFHSYSALSHPDRSILTGHILTNVEKIRNVATTQKQLDRYLNNKKNNFSVAARCEEYERINYKKYLPLSKAVVDLYGHGMKCFRNFESAIYSASFKQDPSQLLYAYPWVDGENCIYLPNKNGRLDAKLAVDIIYEYVKGELKYKLFDIFLKSRQTAIKYTAANYTKNYIFPKLENLIH